MENLITVIGRGHSGTRAISHTLYASGVYMGSQINPSGDKIPPFAMYDACRVMAKICQMERWVNLEFRSIVHNANRPRVLSNLLTLILLM